MDHTRRAYELSAGDNHAAISSGTLIGVPEALVEPADSRVDLFPVTISGGAMMK